MRRPGSSCGLLAGLLLALASCSRDAGPTAELNIYAAQGQEVTTPLIDAYQRRNPGLRIHVIRGGTGELLSRLRAEKASPLADVLWGGSRELYEANADLFASVEVAERDAFEASDPQGKWHPWTRNLIHLVVNTDRVKGDLPKTFADLADPRWARLGGVGLSNPAVSGTAYTIVPALVSVHGWDFMERFLRNCRITDSSETSFKWVKDGEVAAGFLFESMLAEYLAAGAALRAITPEEGLINQDDGCGAIAGARHPEAAASFLNWMATEEAHRIVRGAVGRRSARRGIPPPEGLMDLTGRALIRPNHSWVTRQRDEILRRFGEARARAGR